MPPGTIHLPDWVESEWLKQFVAEQLVTVKTKRGFARLEWQKLRERNEALDTRVYARAAAWIAGLDRWSEERWAEAEREVSRGARTGGAAAQRAPAHAGPGRELARRLARPPTRLAQVRRPTSMSWTETELAGAAARLRQRHAPGQLRRQERRVRLGRRPARPHPHHRGRDRHRRRPPEAAPQLRRLQQGVTP